MPMESYLQSELSIMKYMLILVSSPSRVATRPVPNAIVRDCEIDPTRYISDEIPGWGLLMGLSKY